jgi:SAM-dependent MidA family methyltransferase
VVHSPDASLAARLTARIAREGPIPFRDFMEAALYDPEDGYYSRRAAIGEGGDFVTSPSISPLFARAVARVFAADAESFAGEVVFCEAAAGEGRFLRDFREALSEIAPVLARRTRLRAIERSAAGRAAIERGAVAERIAADAAEWEGERFEGWVFSNELYDALPVHRVEMRKGKLLELGVTVGPPLPAGEGRGEGDPSPPRALSPAASPRPLPPAWPKPLRRGEGPRGEAVREPPTRAQFAWTSWPAPPALAAYLARFGVELAEGQVAEIDLAAAPLHRALARFLARGRLAAFDYGHRAPILYHSSARPRGTLAVHARGRRGGDPLERPGEVDLTAHVNWDDIAAAGEAEGLSTDARMRQSEFLIRAGLFEDAGDSRVAQTRDSRLEAMRLFDPEGIGDALSVLLQSKGIGPPKFRFMA